MVKMMTNNDVEITWKSVDGLSENEVQQKIDGAFDILFEEVIQTQKSAKELSTL